MVAWLLALTPIAIGASLRTHFDALPIAIALAALLAFARERHAARVRRCSAWGR